MSLPGPSLSALPSDILHQQGASQAGHVVAQQGIRSVATARAELLRTLFPAGVPRLWCPTITHFAAAHRPDAGRIRRHLEALAPFVGGILVPGSTGEGWEMGDAATRALLDLVLPAASDCGLKVLVGVLKTDTAGMLRTLAGLDDLFASSGSLAGCVVCPPRGEGLSQAEIATALRAVLDRGRPTAIYQLPQVTRNEIAPETLAELAARFANLVLFKDTSGHDRVAAAGLDLGGTFLVRGAEGAYSKRPRTAGGPYDGFLLSTANAFARELAAILTHLDHGRQTEADAISQRVERAVDTTFAAAAKIPAGNAFANANKALDHHFAFGPSAMRMPPPLLRDGTPLPADLLAVAHAALAAESLLPEAGYCR